MENEDLNFMGTFLIDTGCTGVAARIPYKKVQELQLRKESSKRIRSAGNVYVTIETYPVWIEFTTKSGNIMRTPILIGAHNTTTQPAPPQTVTQTRTTPMTPQTITQTLPTTNAPSTPLTSPQKRPYSVFRDSDKPEEIQISPVKYPADKSKNHDTCLLGPAAWLVLGLGLDTKKQCLYEYEDI